eukprot:768061-Hanusia_phi.AAC.2
MQLRLTRNRLYFMSAMKASSESGRSSLSVRTVSSSSCSSVLAKDEPEASQDLPVAVEVTSFTVFNSRFMAYKAGTSRSEDTKITGRYVPYKYITYDRMIGE